MASSLSDNIPQWKKELILRKRALQNKCSGSNNSSVERQLSNAMGNPTSTVDGPATSGSEPASSAAATRQQQRATPAALDSPVNDTHPSRQDVPQPRNHQQKCATADISRADNSSDKVHQVKMVQDSAISVHKQITDTMVAENGIKHDSDSDTSEELHYGPGIVSKLKSKYLSLTLREKKTSKPRQTILPLRRATSLENLLDAESADENETLNEKNSKPVATRRYTPRNENTQQINGVKNGTNRYSRSTTRSNESMKRARSVETLHTEANNRDLANEDVVIIDKEGNCNHRKWLNDKPIIENKNYNNTQINRPKRLTSFMDDNERPPADHVKHTLMLFEGPAARRTKCPKPTGEVAAKVANFKNIIEKEKVQKKNNINKPQITPKPNIQTKPRKVFRPVSPNKKENDVKKRPTSPLRPVSPRVDSSPKSPVNEFEKIKLRATSPEVSEKLFGSFEKTRQNSETGTDIVLRRTPTPENERGFEFNDLRSPSPKLCLSPEPVVEKIRMKTPSPDYPEKLISAPTPFPRKSLSPTKSPREEKVKSPDLTERKEIPDISKVLEGDSKGPVRTRILSDTPDLILHSSPVNNLPSPNSVKKFTENFICTEKEHVEKLNGVVEDNCDGVTTKTINKQALQNINKACHTVTFSISDNIPKSHLPKLGTVPVGINRLVPEVPKPVQKIIPKIEEVHKIEEVKKIEAINELASPKPVSVSPQQKDTVKINKPKQNVIKNNQIINENNIVKSKPPMPVINQTKNLTNREITKNIINTAKSCEQPISKVVVSVKSVEDVVNNSPNFLVNKQNNKSRNQEQTSLLFNFQDRDTVPDYIAHDSNSLPSRRGKREKPKPGDSGVILLPDAPVDEFLDEDDDDLLNGPPSPCDVHFVNDNVLIDGKSSISKQPKRQKLRIKFDDEATQLFLYPSESSMLENDTTSPSSALNTPNSQQNHAPLRSTSPPPVGHTVASLQGSSLASYQPSKSVPTSFQLGVTRQPPIITAQPRDSLDSTSSTELLEPPTTYSSETSAADILF